MKNSKTQKKLKVLITHELFMPDFAGGGEKLAFETAKCLQNKGHEATVLTTGNPKIQSHEGIPTIRLPINRFLMNFSFFSIMKHAKKHDIIHTSTYNACFASWIAAKLTGKPIVCQIFGLYGKRWNEMRGFFFGWFSRIVEKIQLCRSYNRVLFLSAYSQTWGEEIGISRKRSIVINPGVELDDFKPLPKKKNVVLFSGRFAQQKGVYEVLEVARKLPHLEFFMMGWGEEEETMKKQLPKNVTLSSLSRKNGKTYFSQYGKAPLFFLPSKGETFGFVLAEAMASGCAIVSTIPLGYEGKVVPMGDVDSMVKGIQYYFDHPHQMKKDGEKNVERAKRFNWENYSQELISVYEEVLEESK